MAGSTASPPQRTEKLTLNMGPSHPATHGVLRLVLELDGELVVGAKADLGYLHRGFEKIAENKTYHQFITWTDRMDYLAPLANNTAWVLAVEKLLGLDVPPRCKVIRVLLCELSRISAHLLWLGTHALDLGAATVFFYTFHQREILYDLFEKLSGARFTTSVLRVGGLMRDLPGGWAGEVQSFTEGCEKVVDECESLLTRNRIWLGRTQEVGILSAEDAVALCASGPVLRASGVEYDVRRAKPYLGYEDYEFEIPVGTVGDTYDRYLVRMEEMRQSLRIIGQALRRLPDGPVNAHAPKVVLPDKRDVLTSMEALINQFIIITEGIQAPAGEVYQAIEAPKGELGFYIVSHGGPSAYRCRIRPPSFLNLQTIESMVVGHMVPDVIAAIGSLDPVMGEVDR